jgi:hypothetical protein
MRTSLVSISFALAVLNSSVGKAAESSSTKPLAVLSGTNSHIPKPYCKRITSSDEWTQTWVNHLGTTKDDAYRPTFEIDFGRCLVVAVFRGSERNVRGIEVNSLRETAESLTIQLTELKYQTSGPDTHEFVQPYAFIILPRTSKTIVVEENIQSYKDEAPIWKVYATLKGGVAR